MKTFGDFIRFFSSAKVCMELFGVSEEMEKEFRERSKAVGQVILRENHISREQIAGLPWDTILGEESRAMAESFKAWFNLLALDKK